MLTDFLLNPNIAYLLLVAAFLLILMSLLTPGTGVFEAGAILTITLAGWQIYTLPVNWWALFVLVAGVVPFFLAVRRSGQRLYLIVSIAALVVGSAFMFRGESGWVPGVHPLLASVVSISVGVFLWFVVVKTLEAQFSQPAHDLDQVIGALGMARTDIHYEGTVLVKMEEWSARSEEPIPSGSRVRVTGREGFVLVVEAYQGSPAHL